MAGHNSLDGNFLTDTILDKVVDNFKRTLRAKQRALQFGRFEDIKEFREGVEYHETILSRIKSDAPDLTGLI